MAPYSQCLTTALFLSTLNLTSLPIPNFNVSLLGVHAFNLTCFDIQLNGLGASWLPTTSYAGISEGGTVSCHTNLTAFGYSGVVYADVEVNQSEVLLRRTVEDPESTVSCITNASVIEKCQVSASAVKLYAEPPSSLVDAILTQLKVYIHQHLTDYVCKVLVPRIQSSILNRTYPYTPERGDIGRPLVPIYSSPMLRAFANFLNRLKIGHFRFSANASKQRMSVLMSHYGDTHFGYTGDVVPAPSGEPASLWLEGLVDAYVKGVLPNPFPIYDFPGEITRLLMELNTSRTVFVQFDIDMSVAASSNNWVTLYRDPGVTIENLRIQPVNDGFGTFLTQDVAPALEKLVNAMLTNTLASLASSVGNLDITNSSSSDTITFYFGKYKDVRDKPLVLALIAVCVFGVIGGALLVARNVKQHRVQPVLSSRTGEPLSMFRIVTEDVFLIISVITCLLLITASNTMTAATVVFGDELIMYSFSLSDTITGLWNAGLYALCLCVLVFSGIYPYVKLLSIVAFTVWAHRPCSRVLQFIDSIGKLSLIDIFALMVMVSGLEIPDCASVHIHRALYLFMYGTLLSIAVGNYATHLWRAETVLRCEGGSEKITNNNSTVYSADSDPAADPTAPPEPSATTNFPDGEDPAQPQSEGQSSRWRERLRRCIFCMPLVLTIVCSIPAWVLPSFEYIIGGYVRLLTPDRRSLNLWQLSTLGGRSDALDILAVSLFTIVIAPCLYIGLYPKYDFLASWCAADVLVIACVIGLMQVHRFINFILGDGMEILYSANSTLGWPIPFLAVAAVLVWVFIARGLLQGVLPRKYLARIFPAACTGSR
ncbi:hypothetical protein GH5_05290 [Leishmania sp. Ghana 2012 LV757]|uniref:hypothetical protein n=1 Tax=Leishmania sp. Ghana 2012 LV757 TaxID=2803181 RepID=UPI001B76334B|nr:hypothetical protein GH5_05290 [Leishmania sp. Ghana 2012 LV757]